MAKIVFLAIINFELFKKTCKIYVKNVNIYLYLRQLKCYGGFMDSGTINLIISFVFVLILVIGFLIGFWRGVRRSAVSCAIGLVGVVIAFFITPPITNAIMRISVPYEETTVTLSQYIVEMLKQNADIAALIENNPNLSTLIERLPSAVGNVVVFLVVSALVMLVLYIVYKIIAVTCLKRKEDQKMYRTWGGVIGLVKAFVITIFVFMPISSLFGLVSDITYRSDIYAQTTIENNQPNASAQDGEQTTQENETSQTEDNRSAIGQLLPAEVVNIINGLNDSFFFKMEGAVGLDDAMFDYLSSVEVNGETLHLRQEIISYANVYDVAMQISEISSSSVHTFAELDFDKLEVYLNDILDGTLFRQIVVEIVQDIALNYENYSSIIPAEQLEEYKVLFDDIANGFQEAMTDNVNGAIDYLKNDFNRLFQTFKELAKSGVIDQIMAQEEVSVQTILDMLVENTTAFSNSVGNIFSMNILRDGFNFIFNNFVVNAVEGLDEIVADTSSWQDEDWNNLSAQFVTVISNFSDVASQVDVFDVINDPTSILTKPAEGEEDVNISAVMTSLGKFIDSVRSVIILQTAEGQSIIDSLLTENNFVLPTEEVTANDGSELMLENYEQYLSFISQSLQQIKDNDLYTILTSSSGETTEIIKTIADLVSAEGNHDLLANIFLPLIQVEPTKTLIGEELVSAVQSDLIDLSGIQGYDMWKSELGYVSDILTILNKTDEGGTSYLDYAISGNADLLLQNLGENISIKEILTPVLRAKSTAGIKQALIDAIGDVLNALAGTQIKLSLEGISFVEGDSEDQTDEICLIFEDLLSVYKQYSSSSGDFTFSDIDKTTLGSLLDRIKENAYRVEIDGNTKEGLFKPLFDELYKQFLDEFPDAKTIIKDKPVYEISFSDLMKVLAEIENAAEGSFIDRVGEIIFSSSGVTIKNVEELIGSVTTETTDETLETIETVLGVLEDFEVKIDISGSTEGEIEKNKSQIAGYINDNANLTKPLKDKLNYIFGLNTAIN